MPSSSAGVTWPRWMLFAAMAVAWSLTVWQLGPLLRIGEWQPLGTDLARWFTLAGGGAAATAVVAFRLWRARRHNALIVALLTSSESGANADEEAQVHETTQQSFQQAEQTLLELRMSGARGGRVGMWAELRTRITGRHLYERPWFLMIGAPGSGKTEALSNSGLQFPLAEMGARLARRGIGGTRDFDWWFADRAVFIDTAGRFTTQDSSLGKDRAGWHSLLGLLQKTRARQPLNGVFIAVSVLDLFGTTAANRVNLSIKLRARVHDLCQRLNQRLPMYFLVTKCDLMGGFAETFADLGAEQRRAPWGFAFSALPQSLQDEFAMQFDVLLNRLTRGLIQRLQAESDPVSRVRLYCFPNEFANLRTNLWSVVQQTFASLPTGIEPRLRGIYFVSATQVGMPVDRVLVAVAQQYRIDRAMPPLLPTVDRSFFLQKLLTEVVVTNDATKF